MSEKNGNDPQYLPGHTDKETERLQRQARLLAPSTRWLLERAGIKAGMKVLDVGSGAGDVALLAAELVGPQGCVVGVDTNPTILEIARQRAAGLHHVTFLKGDIREVILDTDFDAAVGRHIFLYITDRAAVLQSIAGHLRPGGILAFQEYDISLTKSLVADEMIPTGFRRLIDWSLELYRRAGSPIQMSVLLSQAFRAAGLPLPQLQVDAMAGLGEQWEGYELHEGTLRSLLPLLVKSGITTEEEADVDTFAQRLRAEVASLQKVLIGPVTVGAWTQKA
ncbi:MAG TPA: methyltransferase domain-containing protein [Ktedonosporobacter sp.]|nr:methyltransferase domain-containing protein [Ktedonosporobacter sp.]